jgi:hypothetical protein
MSLAEDSSPTGTAALKPRVLGDESTGPAVSKQPESEAPQRAGEPAAVTESASSWDGFFRHPAVLLLLGFLFTTTGGSIVTELWKAKEWHNEQGQLGRQRALEKKYALVDELFRSVAETTTAAEDVLATETWTWKDVDAERRKQAWLTTSTNWRISSKIVRQKLNTYFSTPSLPTQFDEIIDTRKQLGNIITNLLTNSVPEKEIPKEVAHARLLIAEIIKDLQVCGKAAAQEIDNPPVDQGH